MMKGTKLSVEEFFCCHTVPPILKFHFNPVHHQQVVPVYSADIPVEDTVFSDNLEQGDSVVHAKYGNGIVEKMIKYGNKTLFSINFDNVGRRLLDPTVTEIKKS